MADHKSFAYFNSLGAFLSLRIVIFSNIRVNGEVLGGQCEDGEGGTSYTCMPLTRNTKITSGSEMLLCFPHPSPQPSLPSLSLVCSMCTPSLTEGTGIMKREFLEAVGTYASPCPIEQERETFTLQPKQTFSGQERGVCLPFLYHLGARKGQICVFHQSNTSLCISGPLPFEWME